MLNFIPALDHCIHILLAPLHPVLGVIVAMLPSYGGMGYAAQIPCAGLAAICALAIHLLKAVVRMLGLGIMNPCIACAEHIVTIGLCMLALCFNVGSVVVEMQAETAILHGSISGAAVLHGQQGPRPFVAHSGRVLSTAYLALEAVREASELHGGGRMR